MSVDQRVQAITNIVQMLSDDEQNALLKELKKQMLLVKAERLNRSIIANNIDMSLIVSEIRKVRASA